MRSTRTASWGGHGWRRHLLLALLLPLCLLVGCSADPYPLLPGPGASEWHPTAVGTPVRAVVLYLQPRPGDQVDLIDAQPIGSLTGADVRFYFSPPVVSASGTYTIGETLDPLIGASASVDPMASPGPANDVGIVAEITPRAAGTYTLTGVRLTLRLNGGGAQTMEGIDSVVTICAADAPPTDCGPTPPP